MQTNVFYHYSGRGTHLEDDPRLLQEIRPHVCPDDVPFPAEANLDVLPKTTTVVVSSGFSVPDRL